jgi:hypothetical protein
MATIKFISGKERLAGLNFLSEVNTYWFPLIGDVPEKVLMLEEVADVGVCKINQHGNVMASDNNESTWYTNSFDVPSGSFLCVSASLSHKKNVHQQDLLLYIRDDADKIAVDVPFVKEDTNLLKWEPFFEGNADLIDLEQAKSVGVKIPEKHFFKKDFIDLFHTKVLNKGKILKRITARQNVSFNYAISLTSKPTEVFNLKTYEPNRVLDFD